MMEFEVIVVGAGHAGCEAALAASRMGARTALLTMDRRAIGRMSCNPSIGGIGKSHIVAEVDALGGEMGRNADYTGLQFRTLNTRKGPAVQATRLQCDKNAYSSRMSSVIGNSKGLVVLEAAVSSLWIHNGRLMGVVVEDGSKISGQVVVFAAGTFLNGKIHIGKKSWAGGRIDEKSSGGFGSCLCSLGHRTGRLKTGTPPRLHKDSLDYEGIRIQLGETPPPFLSTAANLEWNMFHVERCGSQDKTDHDSLPDYKKLFHVEQMTSAMRPWSPGSDQLPCYLTETNEKTHKIIRDHLSESALYGGMIDGTGVRYCPSIEDKIVKFPNNDAHHVFVEPEGRFVDEVYPNGTSNSLPECVQLEMIRSIKGLEKATFIRPGYAIEYDFFDPTGLYHSLESKHIENLFMAGQINGTTGYEEAAGQGFLAGVNAALRVRREKPFVLGRSESYIGVMVDDLVTKGVDEPYRMFTSRAEHRLVLRQDNAHLRLLDKSVCLGIVDDDEIKRRNDLRQSIRDEAARLNSVFQDGVTLAQILRRHGATYKDLPPTSQPLSKEAKRQIEIEVKYDGYVAREMAQIEKSEIMERKAIPRTIDYSAITSLRRESREKLQHVKPETLGQAARIPGVNPVDIALLSVWISRL